MCQQGQGRLLRGGSVEKELSLQEGEKHAHGHVEGAATWSGHLQLKG